VRRAIDTDNALLPMLITGFVLVVLGAIIVMMFVLVVLWGTSINAGWDRKY
tara:strand:+ start:8381 stop:8533 length:153 start_codon:yes stop_codon:yes gene_type:complete